MSDDNRPRTILDGLVPIGPDDTYNGVKVSSFCMECRDAMARYEHGMQASVTLCREDSARVAENAPADPVMVPILKLDGTPMDPLMGPPMSVEQPAPFQREADAASVRAIEAHLARVRALIAAASEMEALLRHIAVEVLPFEYGRPDGKEGGIAEAAQEILARIDAAKAGE